MINIENIKVELKSGDEKLFFNNKLLHFSLLDFWRWSVSDILNNTTRGILAEFLVATAVNIDTKKIRKEWDAFDLETPDGIKIEVKSAAYLQTWEQNKLSSISFSTKPSRPWNSEIDKRSDIPVRSANVYVFCLLNHKDKLTVNPLNLNQWEFYVLATVELNNYTRSQHSITINSLRKLTNAIAYPNLEEEIKRKHKLNVY